MAPFGPAPEIVSKEMSTSSEPSRRAVSARNALELLGRGDLVDGRPPAPSRSSQARKRTIATPSRIWARRAAVELGRVLPRLRQERRVGALDHGAAGVADRGGDRRGGRRPGRAAPARPSRRARRALPAKLRRLSRCRRDRRARRAPRCESFRPSMKSVGRPSRRQDRIGERDRIVGDVARRGC